ncbi:hypothetical protein PI124_g10996 [Phytophthora idaei]|nr:hypothetical protein PI125_g14388 [Phytophthora idaei]KAG3154097.1 hypothetical protein PI126_g9784 [Phytophthora idaei]KAG3244220.1 hypothetical protein PI124_g10996 [Phytophthora idaei]
MPTKAFVATSTKGVFQREASTFRNWIGRNSSAAFPAGGNRYHLYVSLACPWASRCLGALYVKKLDDIIGLSVVHPVFQRTLPDDKNDAHCGWAFADPATTPTLPEPPGLGSYSSKGCIPDTVNKAKFIETCTTCAHLNQLASRAFEDLVPSKVDLYPQEMQSEIDELNEWVHNDVSNGVYKCGFASSQEAYDVAVDTLFNGLDRAEEILAAHRFLVGDRFTEADLRLFTTLIRFDEVYAVNFKANKKLIQQYPNLSNYVRDIYQLSRMAETVVMPHIAIHYYGSHTHLNPFGIIPAGPNVDFTRPHDRDRFTNAAVPTFE